MIARFRPLNSIERDQDECVRFDGNGKSVSVIGDELMGEGR